ncbi:tetratricopeptide repeat protein [Aureisphaera sp. CAU 1614]|uniref:Tetratricopeptide repeat protein n=1 Tax=Halomarinibacterium sedimenti TaxID=2857106 RepID=A0A9X1JW83_9FLAO|nr:tetratricopeptide repeat protein [Halomarinibacterium sedimenti]MBW2936768.1 tetratricopeptide repeat protein [Halomarinibacterium sedimenti]
MKLFFIVLLLVFSPLEKSREQCQEMIQTAIEALHNKEHVKSLELLINAQNMAITYKWYEEQFLALNNIGANYYQLSDYGEALENYLAAYNVALDYLSPRKEMVVLNNVGILSFEEKKYKEAENYFSKAYTIANEYNETVKKGIYAINLGLVHNKLGNLDKANQYLDMAFPLLHNDKAIFLQGKFALAENVYLKGNLEEAINLINSLIPELNNAGLLEHQSEAYLILSNIYQKEGDLLRAKQYGLKAKSFYGSLETLIKVYEQLSLLNYGSKDFEKARVYGDSVITLKDSLFKVKSRNQFEGNKVKFDIKRYEKELEDNTRKFNAERKVFYILIGSFVLLLLLSIWAWKMNISRYKQKRIISERDQKIKMLELENELESKNRKLTVRALNMASRNELLQEVLQTIKSYKDLASNSELKNLMLQLKTHLKNDAGWNDFLIHFEEANYGFLKTLKEKHPSLNTNDIRFISYLYMNLSIKEIATMFNITPDACRKRKERIGKKLGLKDTSNLYQYLSQLQ